MLIKIKNLKLKTNLGIYDWEKSFDRNIIINLEMKVNCQKALLSDYIGDTIDYDVISTNIKDLLKNNRYNLIERMAQEIMDVVMEDRRIISCKLEVEKVGAVDGAESCAIVIEEKANGFN